MSEVPYSPDVAKQLLPQNNWSGQPSSFPVPAILHTQSHEEYIQSELNFSHFDKIPKYLFWAGRPGNISTLNHHVGLGRQIVVTERPYLHLVWGNNIVYVKPLPPFLLNHSFFKKVVTPSEIHIAARWMLFSYAKLIRYPSDLLIARQAGLLAGLEFEREITWPAWAAFASEILKNICVEEFQGRFWYGDLRLDRLNMIFRLRLGIIRGFFVGYDKYGSFFATNFKWVAISFLYVSVVLSAMQVALAGMNANQSDDTQRTLSVVSFSFAVFCMVLVIFVLLLLVLIFLVLFVWNYLQTRSFEGKMKVRQVTHRSTS